MSRGRRPLAAAGFVVVALLACSRPPTRKALKLSDVHQKLGQDYLGRKMPERAKAELLESLRYNPDNQQAHHYLGVIYFLEAVHAVNYIDRAQCLTGAAAVEQREIADSRMRGARKHLRRAIALAQQVDQVDSESLNYLANVAIHFEQNDKAIALCNTALENVLYAGRHLALCNRGWARFQKGDSDGAARDLRQALFQQPEFCLARFRLGKVYFSKKDYRRASQELKKAVEQEKCPIQDAFQLLGTMYLRLGQAESARESFARCVELNPRSCVAGECRRYAKSMDGRALQ